MLAYELRAGQVPRHVVLSACELGQATVRPGDESLGLTSVLLQLGARCVVSGVAEVADDLAAEVTVGYHRRLASGADSATALADAAAAADRPVPFVCLGAAVSFRPTGIAVASCRVSTRSVEIDSLADLDARTRRRRPTLHGLVRLLAGPARPYDRLLASTRAVPRFWAAASPTEPVDVAERLRAGGALLFPALPDVPFDPYRPAALLPRAAVWGPRPGPVPRTRRSPDSTVYALDPPPPPVGTRPPTWRPRCTTTASTARSTTSPTGSTRRGWSA